MYSKLKSAFNQNIKKELILAFFLYILSALLLFIMNAVLAKCVDISVYGQFSYAISMISVLALVASFGLPNATMKYLPKYVSQSQCLEKAQGMVFFSITTIVVISFFISAIIFYLSENVLDGHKMADGISLVPYLLPLTALGLWRAKASRSIQRIADSLVPEGVIRPASVIILTGIVYLVGIEISIFQLKVILIFSYIFSLIYGFFLLLKYFFSKRELILSRFGDYSEFREWTRCITIMFIIDIFQELMMRFDVLIGGGIISSDQVGLYAACSRIAFLNLFFLKIVDMVFAPRMAMSVANKDMLGCWKLLKNSSMISVLGSIPLYATVMIFSEQLLLIFGSNYVQGVLILQILATGQFVNAMTGSVGYALLMSGNEILFLKVCLVYAFIFFLACFFAAKMYGVTGIAISFSVMICVYNITLFLLSRYVLLK